MRLPTVTLSSAESEYVAASFAAREAMYFRDLMRELGFKRHVPTIIHCDNQSAITWLSNPCKATERKHISIRRRYIDREELQERKEIKFRWIKSTANPADFLTKPIDVQNFLKFRSQFMQVKARRKTI